MFEEIPQKNVPFDFMEILRETVSEQMVEGLVKGKLDCSDSMVKDFVYLSISHESHFNFLKAVGLLQFKDDEQAQLIINDFIGLLKDMYSEGAKSFTGGNR